MVGAVAGDLFVDSGGTVGGSGGVFGTYTQERGSTFLVAGQNHLAVIGNVVINNGATVQVANVPLPTGQAFPILFRMLRSPELFLQ